jgi:hypothetical protein
LQASSPDSPRDLEHDVPVQESEDLRDHGSQYYNINYYTEHKTNPQNLLLLLRNEIPLFYQPEKTLSSVQKIHIIPFPTQQRHRSTSPPSRPHLPSSKPSKFKPTFQTPAIAKYPTKHQNPSSPSPTPSFYLIANTRVQSTQPNSAPSATGSLSRCQATHGSLKGTLAPLILQLKSLEIEI